MKKWVMVLVMMIAPAMGWAADGKVVGPEERGFPADYREAPEPPEGGGDIRKYAEDAQDGAQRNFGVQPVHDNELFAVFKGDRLEYQSREGGPVLLWDVEGWVGRDFNKLYLESEGVWSIDDEEVAEAEVELLYGRTITSFWDLRVGVRHDFRPDPDRTFAALGVQGMAPYRFEVDATAYVSEDGDVSAGLEVEYDLLLSQRLILQPRLETGIAVQEVEEYGVGQGFTDIELGLRLHYEIRREFAPYIGVSWSRKLGETADLTEAEGGDIETTSFVAGVRFWF
ncbi:MAG: copper resistance protein B [Desulfobacterales bacterium]